MEQEPVKKTFCQSLRRDTHWKCLILTMLISGCLAAITWCRLVTVDRNEALGEYSGGTPCEDGYVYIPVAFVLMLYLVYLVECWHCHTRIQLQWKLDVSTVYDHIHTLQEALPIVWWKALCYHYVRRTRQVTRYRNGDAFTTTQVYYERVNSHTASSAFNFTRCGIQDVSKRLVNLEKYPATKIRISKGFSFAVLDAEQEYEEQRAQFFQEHERLDDYMETREGLDLMNASAAANFKEYMIAFADAAHLPWYVSQAVFWLASFLLLSWPLRVLIEYKTAYVHYHVHKLFGTSILDNVGQTSSHMTRENTLASMELEMNIRNNNSIVPSYSEALLMDTANQMVSYQDGNSRTGYTPIPGSVHYTSKYYSPNGELSYHSERGSSQIYPCTAGTSPDRHTALPPGCNVESSGRNVILRIPQCVGSRLRGKRRFQWRRHSYAEVLPLRDIGGPSRPPRSSSMLDPAQFTGGNPASRQLSRSLGASEPDVIQAGSHGAATGSTQTISPDIVTSSSAELGYSRIVNPDVIGCGRNTETIPEVDSETGSPVPTRSSQSSLIESCGSNTPLLSLQRKSAASPASSTSVHPNQAQPTSSTGVHPNQPKPTSSTSVHTNQPKPTGPTSVHPNHPKPTGSTIVQPNQAQPTSSTSVQPHQAHHCCVHIRPDTMVNQHNGRMSNYRHTCPRDSPSIPTHCSHSTIQSHRPADRHSDNLELGSNPAMPRTPGQESPPSYEAALCMQVPYPERVKSTPRYQSMPRQSCICHNTGSTVHSDTNPASNSGWVEARQLRREDRNSFKIMETAL